MASEVSSAAEGVHEAVEDVALHARRVASLQAELLTATASAEGHNVVQAAATAAASAAAAAVLGLMALGAAIATLAVLLSLVLPWWASLLIVTVVVAAVAALLVLAAMAKARTMAASVTSATAEMRESLRQLAKAIHVP